MILFVSSVFVLFPLAGFLHILPMSAAPLKTWRMVNSLKLGPWPSRLVICDDRNSVCCLKRPIFPLAHHLTCLIYQENMQVTHQEISGHILTTLDSNLKDLN